MPDSPVKNMKSGVSAAWRWFCRGAIALVSVILLPGPSAISQENAAAVADSISLSALRTGAQELSVYELAFVLRDTLTTDATITLEFPPAFDLAGAEIAGSQDVDGGFRLAREQQRISLQRSGLGSKIAPGKRVRIKLGLIQNPENPAAAAAVRVSFRPGADRAAAPALPVNVRFNAN